MDSILNSIKKQLGITAEYTHFDDQLIIHINSVLMILTQLNVGPPEGFFIEDANASWSDFLGENTQLESVKSYVYMKVRLLFDPPTISAVLESMNRLTNEFEWRLNVAADVKKSE